MVRKIKQKRPRKGRRKKYDRHHRKPKGDPKRKRKENIVKVLMSKHRAWHHLFGSGHDPHHVARVINRTWIDPDYRLVVQKRPQRNKKQ